MTTLTNKQQLISERLINLLSKASNEALANMLKRTPKQRTYKMANYHISNVKLSELFSNEELYAIIDVVYDYAEDKLSPTGDGIVDDALLKQLKAK